VKTHGSVEAGAPPAHEVCTFQRKYIIKDAEEDTAHLQNAVRSNAAMEPEESVAFASLFYLYNGRHDVRYNGRILCARVAPA
jgi:hypothetical protein